MNSAEHVQIIHAAVGRSMRLLAILGALGALLGLSLMLTGSVDRVVAFGVIPLPWFMLGLGGLCTLVAYSRWAEFKELGFELVGAGVRTRESVIAWEDIRELYRGGTTDLAQGLIRSGEDRKITIVAKDGRVIKLDLKFIRQVSPPVKEAFDALCSQIVRRISEPQRRELDARLAAGERVRFNDKLWVGADGVAWGDEGPPKIPLGAVRGLEAVEGHLKLHYLDNKGDARTRAIGRFGQTANVHLLDDVLGRPRSSADRKNMAER